MGKSGTGRKGSVGLKGPFQCSKFKGGLSTLSIERVLDFKLKRLNTRPNLITSNLNPQLLRP